jgi:putative mRNA 3-end processing factor
MRPRRSGERAFRFARGIRLRGTNIVCDAPSGELIFVAHAQALGALGPRRAVLRRAGRQELLITEPTLSLLGAAGARLRRHALPVQFGRPFSLGESRVELFPSGHMPGSASLLVETDGRRMVYAGTVRMGRPGFGATTAELRPAEALCVDATFGDPRFAFPEPAVALEQAYQFVKTTLAAGRAPVLLAPAFSTAMELASSLAAAGLALRGHRSILAAAAAFRAAGTAAPPIARFGGKLDLGEALLWPPELRGAPQLARLGNARFAFVSGFSQDPEAVARVGADVGIPLSNQSDCARLLGYIEAAGAREVAVHRGHADAFAAMLRARGLDAYSLGPPRQMDMFRG